MTLADKDFTILTHYISLKAITFTFNGIYAYKNKANIFQVTILQQDNFSYCTSLKIVDYDLKIIHVT